MLSPAGPPGRLTDALTVPDAGEPRLLGYADARVPEPAPGRPRLRDTPIDELVETIVAHIRAVRPQTLITHDAYGQLTGHPGHVRTHQATVLAFHAAGLEHRYPAAGPPWLCTRPAPAFARRRAELAHEAGRQNDLECPGRAGGARRSTWAAISIRSGGPSSPTGARLPGNAPCLATSPARRSVAVGCR
ncbi:PIG-L deacetylase family protein [Streptomyces sp. NPDC004284]|uniref:PIG-L deacetylase family protein n=1 Tax=Streptomyces sp. NPDC004284 TaxID=3364695 RepID=UPI0036A71A6E